MKIVVENRCEYNKKLHLNDKLMVINYYGGKCCACGEANTVFLVIDHVNNGGREHRRRIGGSNTIYRWMINNGFPPGFQVLCHNCNAKKEADRRRHNYIYSYRNNAQRRHNHKLKLTVIDHYGGKCRCCGNTNIDLLTVDHINGGGCNHRRIVGRGMHFYVWLIRNGFPLGYQVLCWNCNLGKSINGGTCPHNGELI